MGESAAIEVRTVEVELRDLKELPDNAHFMPSVVYRQLVENLRNDGVLTSAPLVYQGVVLSGNHRVKAAIDAGIERAVVLELVGDLSEQRVRAIALSHNAINGQDDPVKLAEQYSKLDLQWKQYSGLTDDIVAGVKPLDLAALGIQAPKYEELTLLFLPDEAEVVMAAVKAIEKSARRQGLAARFDDFDLFFDALVKTKRLKRVHNTALALRTMAELALKQLEAEGATDVDGGTDGTDSRD